MTYSRSVVAQYDDHDHDDYRWSWWVECQSDGEDELRKKAYVWKQITKQIKKYAAKVEVCVKYKNERNRDVQVEKQKKKKNNEIKSKRNETKKQTDRRNHSYY